MRGLGRAAAILAALPVATALGYLALAFGLGAVPVGSLTPEGPEAIPIHVVSNGYHASFVLPVRAAGIDWAELLPEGDFAAPAIGRAHVMFGWGDRDFYMATRRLEDVRLRTALSAIASQGGTVIQAAFVAPPHTGALARRIWLTPAQYREISGHVAASFARDAAGALRPYRGMGYGRHDAFYAAEGRYSLVRTCNEWVGQGLRRAGIRTGLWTPFAQSILWHLR